LWFVISFLSRTLFVDRTCAHIRVVHAPWLVLITLAGNNLDGWRRAKSPLFRVCPIDNEVQYWLGRPVQSTRPTPGWRSGEVVADTWDIVTDPSLPAGRYRLEVEVYDAASALSVGVAQVGVLQVEASK
jgi:hypothetical protein